MAIKKEIEFKGFVSNYWRISSIARVKFDEDGKGGSVEFYVEHFKDKETRDKTLENAISIQNKTVHIHNLNGNIREQIYTQIMKEKEFDGSEKC